MDTKKENIRYNYYGIECVSIVNSIDDTTNKRNISSSFRGKENNPNIIYSKKSLNIHYQATNIYLSNKSHVMNKYDGEIVILHKPTTLSLKLYTCFPYMKSSKESKNIGIDDLINSESNSLSNLYQPFPVSIELNKCIKVNPTVVEYQTVDKHGEQCIVLYFDNVIKISSNLDGRTLQDAPFTIHPNKPDISIVEDKLKSPSILIEGFHETIDLSGTSQRISDGIKSMQKSAQEQIELQSQNFQSKKVSKQNKDDSEVIYKCEYLPVDTDEMVQVLQVPIGTPSYHYGVGNQISGLFISTTIFIFSILLIFFISPILYGLLESLFISKTFLENIIYIKTHTNFDVNLLNLIIILSFVITTIFLLLYGFMYWDIVAISVALFLPFFALISYVGITFFRRTKNVMN